MHEGCTHSWLEERERASTREGDAPSVADVAHDVISTQHARAHRRHEEVVGGLGRRHTMRG